MSEVKYTGYTEIELTDEQYNEITGALSRLYDSNRLRDNKDISGKVARVVKTYIEDNKRKKISSANIYKDVMNALNEELLKSGAEEVEQLNNNSEPEYRE